MAILLSECSSLRLPQVNETWNGGSVKLQAMKGYFFLIYRGWFGESPLFPLERISFSLGTKVLVPYQRLILPYQGLSFPYTRLSLRGVRDSEARKFADNIAFADFLLLGAYY